MRIPTSATGELAVAGHGEPRLPGREPDRPLEALLRGGPVPVVHRGHTGERGVGLRKAPVQLHGTDRGLAVELGDVTVEEFCGSVLIERPSELLHGFVVTCGGRYAGVGATLALLQASAAAMAVDVRGNVTVLVLIDPRGWVAEAKVVSGPQLLAAGSVAAAKESLFEPAPDRKGFSFQAAFSTRSSM